MCFKADIKAGEKRTRKNEEKKMKIIFFKYCNSSLADRPIFVSAFRCRKKVKAVC